MWFEVAVTKKQMKQQSKPSLITPSAIAKKSKLLPMGKECV
jgi:hypothetical protein